MRTSWNPPCSYMEPECIRSAGARYASEFTDILRRISFVGASGVVSFDDNGDRSGSLLIQQIYGHQYIDVGRYFTETDSLSWASGSASNVQFATLDGRPPADREPISPPIPVDTPLLSNEELVLLLVGASLLLVALVVGGGFILVLVTRRARYDAMLTTLQWRIGDDELESLTHRPRRGGGRTVADAHASRLGSLGSLGVFSGTASAGSLVDPVTDGGKQTLRTCRGVRNVDIFVPMVYSL